MLDSTVLCAFNLFYPRIPLSYCSRTYLKYPVNLMLSLSWPFSLEIFWTRWIVWLCAIWQAINHISNVCGEFQFCVSVKKSEIARIRSANVILEWQNKSLRGNLSVICCLASVVICCWRQAKIKDERANVTRKLSTVQCNKHTSNWLQLSWVGLHWASSRLPCYVFCICMLYQKYKSVELSWIALSSSSAM